MRKKAEIKDKAKEENCDEIAKAASEIVIEQDKEDSKENGEEVAEKTTDKAKAKMELSLANKKIILLFIALLVTVGSLHFAYSMGYNSYKPEEIPVDTDNICEAADCSLLQVIFPYHIYTSGKTIYLYDQVNDERVVVSEYATLYDVVHFNDSLFALLLKRGNKLALYGLAQKSILIPFADYDTIILRYFDARYLVFSDTSGTYFVDLSSGERQNVGYASEVEACIDKSEGLKGFILHGNSSSAFFNIKTMELTMDFDKYTEMYYLGGNFIIYKNLSGCSRSNEDGYILCDDRQGIYDFNKKTVVVKPESFFIAWSEKSCTLYEDNWCSVVYDIFNIATGDFVLKKKPYRQDADVRKMLDIINIFSSRDFGRKKIDDFNTLDNQTKLQIAFFEIIVRRGVDEDLFEENEDDDSILRASVLKTEFQKVFGKDVSYQDESIKCMDCGDISYFYDKKSKAYISWGCECESHGRYSLYDEIHSYEKIDDLYILSVYRLIGGFGPGGEYGEYSGALNGSGLFSDYYTDSDGDAIILYLKDLDKYKKKSPLFKYTFRKEGKNFVLVAFDYLAPK